MKRNVPGTVYASSSWGVHCDLPLFHSGGIRRPSAVLVPGYGAGVRDALWTRGQRVDSCTRSSCRGSPTEEAPDPRSGCCGFDSRSRYACQRSTTGPGARLAGEASPFESDRWLHGRRTGVQCCLASSACSVRYRGCPPCKSFRDRGKGSAGRTTVESGAHWWATGLENQAGVTGVRGPASNALTLRNTTELKLGLVDVIVGD